MVDPACDVQGRQRALGNIQFVGQLYKKAMLTEKIMHECIMTLLADVSPPPPFLYETSSIFLTAFQRLQEFAMAHNAAVSRSNHSFPAGLILRSRPPVPTSTRWVRIQN